MASKINADEFVDREGEGKPTLPKGVVLSGVTTITTAVVAENEVANSTGINAGIITSTHFKGNLTGDVNAGIVTVTSQSVIGSAVTISASGIDIGAGVITATSYAGSGANLTGVGATIMTWEYNPEIDSTSAPNSTGIGITFNQKIKAGSGNITVRSGGYDGTVVENFGIGSSVTISNNSLSFTPTSSLTNNAYYYVTLPSGVITNMAGENYVGTGYSFKVPLATYTLWGWGRMDDYGQLSGAGQGWGNTVNDPTASIWGQVWVEVRGNYGILGSKNDGTLWAWGQSEFGALGLNQGGDIKYSSPVQIPGTTWKIDGSGFGGGNYSAGALKTDGTLWTWGNNDEGRLGLNQATPVRISSPTQIPGTTWSKLNHRGDGYTAIKTDGTLWTWGNNARGQLGQNNETVYSSPKQVPGTTWSIVGHGNDYGSQDVNGGIKTDGTLWLWGDNDGGALGQNNLTQYSSPVQIPGTTWANFASHHGVTAAVKTDGTMWRWGANTYGQLGMNNRTSYSSPIQIPGTTWVKGYPGEDQGYGTKSDGTIWSMGRNRYYSGGFGNTTPAGMYSSPTQIPGTWHTTLEYASEGVYAFKSS